MEAGKLLHAAHDFEASNRYFMQAEAILDDFENRAQFNLRSGVAEIGAAVTNPNAVPYQGSYADKIMINTYKALMSFQPSLGDLQNGSGEAEGSLIQIAGAEAADNSFGTIAAIVALIVVGVELSDGTSASGVIGAGIGAVWEVIVALRSFELADAALDSIGLLIIGFAVIETAKFIAEEEILSNRELRSPLESRRSLTKFITIIVIAANAIISF